MDENSGLTQGGMATGGGSGASLASISTRNIRSMNALSELLGVDRAQLDRLVDDAWTKELEKDPRLVERALSDGVQLEVSNEDASAAVCVERNKHKIEGRPLYVIWLQGQATRAAQTRPVQGGGVTVTWGALARLCDLMPDMTQDEIRSLLRESIECAEREGRVDTRWHPSNYREDQGECRSIWLPASREGDRDLRIAYSCSDAGMRKVFYVERQRAMQMLESFAYMGDWSAVLETLAGMAKPEPWDSGDGSRSILRSYLKATYARVERQGKVCFSEDGHAAFDTGLTTPIGDRIVALFGPNDRPDVRQQYKFMAFVTPQGRGLARAYLGIVSATRRATYVERSSDLVMGWSDGTPTLSERHILIDRVDRLPIEFLRSIDQIDAGWKALLDGIAASDADEEACDRAYEGMRAILESNGYLFEMLRTLIRAAADKAFEDLKVYPYNALPIYNPERDDLAFVLPIQLMSRTGRPNAALLVEEVEQGVFRAHTILTMEMAYVDARVISTPQNCWLAEQYSADAVEIRMLKEKLAKLQAEFAKLQEGRAKLQAELDEERARRAELEASRPQGD